MTATTQHHHLQTYTLKLGKSKLLLNDIVLRHNTVHPLRTRLRAAHVGLVEKLLWLYSSHLNKEQAYGAGIQQGAPLPPLRTNNVQLAGLLACSERTVHNLIERLKRSGIVTNKVFRGSNSSYELHLSTSVLHIEARGQQPDNVAPLFQTGADQAVFLAAKMKSLPHTVTSKRQVTKKLNKLDGADCQQAGAAPGFAGDLDVGNLPTGVENIGKLVENLRLSSEQGTKPDTQRTGYEHAGTGPVTAPPVAAAPPRRRSLSGVEAPAPNNSTDTVGNIVPTKAPVPAGIAQTHDTGPQQQPAPTLPDTPEEVVAGLPPELQASILRHVAVMWTAAAHQLYPTRWIADTEADRARAALAEYLRWARPERYSAGADEVLERIALVRRWIERGLAEGKNRWVPLPSGYFDHRNAAGFQATKPWFKKHIATKAEIKSKELLTKALKQYMRALDGKADTGPAETYRIIAQRLGKVSKELAQEFNRQVAEVATQQKSN